MILANFPQNFIGSINSNTNFPPQSQSQISDIPADWFNGAFKRRVPITINANQITGTQTDFPFLFNSLFTDLEGNAKADGGDIRFALQDKTELKSEIQFIDVSTNNGELIAWTKVPSINDTTSFFMYYNNPNATLPTDPENVWDSSYRGVYHMTQTTFGVGTTLDSTANNNDGNTVGSPISVTGQIGKAYRTLSGGIITVPSSTSIDAIGSTSFTLSMWTKNISSLFEFYGILEKKLTFNGSNRGWQWWNDFRAAVTGITTRLNDTTDPIDELMDFGDQATNALINNANFKYLVFTYDASSQTGLQYIDAVVGITNTFTGTNNTFNNTQDLKFGDSGQVIPIDATFDEVRLQHDVVKSSNLITAEFNNQKTPLTFYTVGAVQTIP